MNPQTMNPQAMHSRAPSVTRAEQSHLAASIAPMASASTVVSVPKAPAASPVQALPHVAGAGAGAGAGSSTSVYPVPSDGRAAEQRPYAPTGLSMAPPSTVFSPPGLFSSGTAYPLNLEGLRQSVRSLPEGEWGGGVVCGVFRLDLHQPSLPVRCAVFPGCHVSVRDDPPSLPISQNFLDPLTLYASNPLWSSLSRSAQGSDHFADHFGLQLPHDVGGGDQTSHV